LKIAVLCGGAAVLIGGGVLALVLSGVFRSKPDDTSGNGSSGKKTLDVAFVHRDFNGAVVLHPQRMLGTPLLKSVSQQDKLFEFPVKAFGVDPRKIEQVIFLVDPYGAGSAPVLGAGIFRFSEAVDGKKILKQVLLEGGEETLQGKTYYRQKNVGQLVPEVRLCGHVANDRTLVVAPELTLQKMLLAKEEKSPLIDALRAIDVENDVVGVFAMTEQARKLMGEQLKPLKGKDLAGMEEVTDLHDHLKSMTFALNLSGDTLLKVDLEGKDEKSATVLHGLAQKGHNFAKLVYPEVRKRLQDPGSSEQTQPVFAVLDEVFGNTGIKVDKDGLRTIVRVPTPKGLAELPRKLEPLLKGMMAGPPKQTEKKKPIIDQAVAWLKDNKAVGRDEEFVTNVTTRLSQQVLANQGFCLRLGSGLVKSQKQTLLCGWGGELHVFELNAAQEKDYALGATTFVVHNVIGNEPLPGRPEVQLSAPKFDRAENLDPSKKITGSVTFKKLAAGKGPYTLRLMLMNGGAGLRQPLAGALPSDNAALTFSFLSLDEAFIKHTGPLVAVLDLASTNQLGVAVPVSNPVAVLLNVSKPAAPVGGGDLLATIQKLGGQPIYKDYNSKNPIIGATFSFQNKVTDETLSQFTKLSNLEELNLGYTKITGKGLAHLTGFKRLRVLNLGGIKIGDADLAHLAKLTSLERLTGMLAEEVTDKGLAHLSGLTNLQELYLNYSKISDDGLKYLKGMKAMKYLFLRGAPLTGSGLAQLKEMANLTYLDLDGSKVDDASLTHLAGLAKLSELYLSGTGVTDDGLKHLKGMKELRTLYVQKTSVTGTGLKDVAFWNLYAGDSKFNDEGLKAIAGNTKIWTLHLGATKVTDDGLKHLKGLANLSSLNLNETKVTGTGLSALKGLKYVSDIKLYKAAVTDEGLKFVKDLAAANVYLSLDYCPITDKGLAHFKGLNNISSLNLSDITKITDAGLANLEGLTKATQILLYRTAVTKEGVDKLKKALPKCFIQSSPFQK
jgi:Leucine-rich repeat (LRR) protein